MKTNVWVFYVLNGKSIHCISRFEPGTYITRHVVLRNSRVNSLEFLKNMWLVIIVLMLLYMIIVVCK